MEIEADSEMSDVVDVVDITAPKKLLFMKSNCQYQNNEEVLLSFNMGIDMEFDKHVLVSEE